MHVTFGLNGEDDEGNPLDWLSGDMSLEIDPKTRQYKIGHGGGVFFADGPKFDAEKLRKSKWPANYKPTQFNVCSRGANEMQMFGIPYIFPDDFAKCHLWDIDDDNKCRRLMERVLRKQGMRDIATQTPDGALRICIRLDCSAKDERHWRVLPGGVFSVVTPGSRDETKYAAADIWEAKKPKEDYWPDLDYGGFRLIDNDNLSIFGVVVSTSDLKDAYLLPGQKLKAIETKVSATMESKQEYEQRKLVLLERKKQDFYRTTPNGHLLADIELIYANGELTPSSTFRIVEGEGDGCEWSAPKIFSLKRPKDYIPDYHHDGFQIIDDATFWIFGVVIRYPEDFKREYLVGGDGIPTTSTSQEAKVKATGSDSKVPTRDAKMPDRPKTVDSTTGTADGTADDTSSVRKPSKPDPPKALTPPTHPTTYATDLLSQWTPTSQKALCGVHISGVGHVFNIDQCGFNASVVSRKP